jgi:hypothetical protein
MILPRRRHTDRLGNELLDPIANLAKMTKKERNEVKAIVASELARILLANSAVSKPEQEPQPLTSVPTIPPRSNWRFPKWMTLIASSLIGVCWAFFVYCASWSLDYPSGSLRSNNPFTTVFTFTNTGQLPAESVTITCKQRVVELNNGQKLPGATMYNLAPAASTTAPHVGSGEKLSFVCQQVISGWSMNEGRVPLDAPMPVFTENNPDLPVTWADFEFTIAYSPFPFIHIPFWAAHRRMIGQPDKNGSFVWAAATMNQTFDQHQ